MLLRIVRIQPPIDVSTMVNAGRIECQSTSEMKVQDNSLVTSELLPNACGNQPSVMANTRMQIRPIQK